jgi:hypothetical protein
MTSPHRAGEQSLGAELRSSALLLALLVVVIAAGVGLGVLADWVS